MNFPIQDFVKDYLTDYGSPFAVDVRPGSSGTIEFITQKCFDCPSGLGLFPTNPSLPLLPPSNYSNLKKEPCFEDKIRCKKNLELLLSLFEKNKNAMGHEIAKLSAEEMLSKLENLNDYDEDDGFKIRQFYSLLMDFKPECFGAVAAPKVATFNEAVTVKRVQDLDVNSDYTGGGVSYLSYENNTMFHEDPGGILVYPSGGKLDQLSFNCISVFDDQLCVTKRKCEIDLADDGRIFETKVASTHCQAFAMCRQAKRCSIFQIEGSDCAASSCARFLTSHSWSEDDRPTSISISPYIESEFLVSTRSGTVYLWSPQSKNQMPVSVIEGDKDELGWTSCHFGGHPRLAVFTNRTSVSIHDIGRTRLPLVLLHMPHRCFHSSDKLMVTAKCTSPFYHVIASRSHVVLMDERKPNDPVLTWKPWFLSPPQYLDVVHGIFPSPAVDDLLLVGMQDSAETFCFQLHLENERNGRHYPVQACGNYWRASRVDCCARIATRQGDGRYSTVTSSRLGAPLTGVCGIPHGIMRKRTGVSVVQMTSFGDLFYQTYMVKKDDGTSNKTYCSGPGSENIALSSDALSCVGRWLDSARTQYSDQIRGEVLNTSQSIDLSHLFHVAQAKYVPLATCNLCRRRGNDSMVVPTVSDDDTCLSCKMMIKDSHAMLKAIEQDVAVPLQSYKTASGIQLDDALSAVDVDKFHDAEAELLLMEWRGETDLDDALTRREEEHVKLFHRMYKPKESMQAGNTKDVSDELEDDADELDSDAGDELDCVNDSRHESDDSLQTVNSPEFADNDGDMQESLPDPFRVTPPAKGLPLRSESSQFSNASEIFPPVINTPDTVSKSTAVNGPNTTTLSTVINKSSTTVKEQQLPHSSSRSLSFLVNTPGFLVTPSRHPMPLSPAPSSSSVVSIPSVAPLDSVSLSSHSLSTTTQQPAVKKRKPYRMGF